MRSFYSTQSDRTSKTSALRLRQDGASAASWHRFAHIWRFGKHGPVRRVPLLVRNGIRVTRVHVSSMVSNTCCTTLLMQGAPPCSPP